MGLAGALALAFSIHAYAQQPAATPPPPASTSILQTKQLPRQATNLAPPAQADDTFLGQEKPGPYALTWRNFQAGFGNTVQVFLDGKLLLPGTYTLDVVKGEVTFPAVVKRTQLIRVRYGYYVGIAQRNANPAPTAPLTVSLAALGIGNLSMTALPTADNTPSKVVWTLSSKAQLLGGGFTSQLNFAPDGTQGLTGGAGTNTTSLGGGSAADRAGIQLGYAGGNARNGLDLSFQRGGKQFAPSVGKALGYTAPTENFGIGGRVAPMQWLAFNVGRSEIRDLNGKGGSETNALGFRLGGTKGAPLLNFAQSTEEKRDANGKITETVSQKGDLAAQLGATRFTAQRNELTSTAPDKKQSGALQQNVGLSYNAKNAPQLNITKTEDTKTDLSGYKSGSINEQSSLAAKLAGAEISAKTAKTFAATPDKKSQVQGDQESYAINYAPKGQPSVVVLRNNDFKITNGVRTGTALDKSEFNGKYKAGKFGVADIVARTQKLTTATPDKTKAGTVDTDTIGLNLTGGKVGVPAVNLNRTNEDRTDSGGALTRTTSDALGFRNQFGALNVDVKSLSADIEDPNKKRTDLEQQTYTLGMAGGKGKPTLGFFRTEDERKPENASWFGAVLNRYDMAQRVGTADITYQLQQGTQTAADLRQATADLATFNLKLAGGARRPVLNYNRVTDEKTDLAANRTEVVTDKVDLTSKLGVSDVTARTTKAVTNAPDPKTSGIAQDTAVSLTAPGGTKGTGATLTVLQGQTETGAALEQRQGLGIKVQPSPKVAIGAEQKDQLVTALNADGTPGTRKNVVSTTTSAELSLLPGAKFTGAWKSTEDGQSRSGINDYSASFGFDKSALQFAGSFRDRYSLGAAFNAVANLDTANAKVALRPFSGFTVTGAYTLNPEDPKQPGKVIESERREYGLNANLGAIQIGGTYAFNDLPMTAAEAVKAGAPQFGEYNLTLGLRFNRYTNFNGSYKNSFFYGGATKGLQLYTFGLTHAVGSQVNFTLGGTVASDLSAVSGPKRYNYKAEAKLGVKF